MAKILITNDDGIEAPGIRTMASVAAAAGFEVTICAPDRQRSAASHSLTLTRPLMAWQVTVPDTVAAYAVDGKPVDCARLGVRNFCPDADWVISGINHGYNCGIDVLYSGTVAAAMEGAILGKRALAVSLDAKREDTYVLAAEMTIQVILAAEGQKLPPQTILNLNYPGIDRAKGLCLVPMKHTVYDDTYIETVQPDGRMTFELHGGMAANQRPGDEDYDRLMAGYATLTIFHHDWTCREAMVDARKWISKMESYTE